MIVRTNYGRVMVKALYDIAGDPTEELDEAVAFFGVIVEGRHQGETISGNVSLGTVPLPLD